MALQGALAETVRENKELITGESAITASITVTTEYATIYSVQVTQKKTTAPGLGASTYTYDVTDNVVSIFAWKPTSVSNPTLIAATVASAVGYTIIGRRRQ